MWLEFRLSIERDFIHWLTSQAGPAGLVELGIGDDAAIVRAPRQQVVLATDAIAEGVHFSRDLATPGQIGRKALAVNLSDLAAMGALPVCCLLALSIPDTVDLSFCQRITQGIKDLAAQWQCPLVGGDLIRTKGPLHLCVTVVGQLPIAAHDEPWRIDGAQPGDQIFVSGPLGGSLRGRHLDFQPRLDLVMPLRKKLAVSAATDISDSLAVDLYAICRKSGVGAVIDASLIPVSPAAKNASPSSEHNALEHALYDGEDFELILVLERDAAAGIADLGLIRIGEIREQEFGVKLAAEGKVANLPERGYSH